MDKSKSYMTKLFNNDCFPNSWLYNIPLDLSSFINKNNSFIESENDLSENENIADKYIVKFLPKNLISILFEDDSELTTEESFSNNINNYYNLDKNLESQSQNENKTLNLMKKKKEEEKVCSNLNSINNFHININNPRINFVNIYYPFSFNLVYNYFPNDVSQKKFNSNSYLNNSSKSNSKYINNSLINNNVCSNVDNYNFISNSANCINYSKEKVDIQINNNNFNNINNTPQKEDPKEIKKSKKKKKKKKKINDNYTIEVFGRRGWICENCNNFNYESRKTCNRCKIVKTPIKKSILFDENGINILNNIFNGNNKKEWNCPKCGNINYSFRIICNRCQVPKEINIENNEE